MRIHPLMLLFPLAATMLGAGEDGPALLIALFIHEGAHLLAARRLRVGVRELRLMPFGGAIALDNPYVLPPGKLFGVAAAGPAGSLLALVFCAALAHWGLLPPPLAKSMAQCNLMLMLFNLLPALPLDGGRMMYALLSGRIGRGRAAELGILLGRIVAGLLLALALYAGCTRHRLNLSLVLCAVFMLGSAQDERRALSDVRARTLLNELTPLSAPIPVRLFAVSEQCPVRTALRAADPGALTMFAVYSGDRFSGFTDDHRLLNALLAQPSGDAAAGACIRRG